MTISLILDTETTGLPLPSVADLSKQPRIIELALVRVVDGVVVSEHEWLIQPECELPAVITKITGLKDEDLAGKPKFAAILEEIKDAFAGADMLIAHNIEFDCSVLQFELERCKCENFPWPKQRVCTVQEFVHIKGRRLKLTELFELLTGGKLEQTHRALSDCNALYSCIKDEDFLK